RTDEWTGNLAKERAEICKNAEEIEKEYQKEKVRKLADDGEIDISLLGIHLGAADLDFFGSAGLLFAAIFYLLCLRREHHEIRSLANEVSAIKGIDRHYVYLGLRQSFVVNTSADPEPAAKKRLIDHFEEWFSSLAYLPAVATLGIVVGNLLFLWSAKEGGSWTVLWHWFWDWNVHIRFMLG